MKYSAEEVKKIMGEGVSDNKIFNLRERARQSIEVDDLEHASEYYKQILDEDPNDWEAYFYTYLGERMSYTNAQAGSVAARLGATIPAAYDMAIKTGRMDEISDRLLIITEKTASRLESIALTGATLLREYEGGNIFTPTGKVHADLYKGMRDTAQNTIINSLEALESLESRIEKIDKSDKKIDEDIINKCLLVIRRKMFDIANWEFYPQARQSEKLVKEEVILSYSRKINELDPTHHVKTEQEIKIEHMPQGAKSKGYGKFYSFLMIFGCISSIINCFVNFSLDIGIYNCISPTVFAILSGMYLIRANKGKYVNINTKVAKITMTIDIVVAFLSLIIGSM